MPTTKTHTLWGHAQAKARDHHIVAHSGLHVESHAAQLSWNMPRTKKPSPHADERWRARWLREPDQEPYVDIPHTGPKYNVFGGALGETKQTEGERCRATRTQTEGERCRATRTKCCESKTEMSIDPRPRFDQFLEDYNCRHRLPMRQLSPNQEHELDRRRDKTELMLQKMMSPRCGEKPQRWWGHGAIRKIHGFSKQIFRIAA